MNKYFLLLMIWAVIFFEATAGAQVKVILDTDMAGDCDDAGALAVLHALMDNGETELMAVMISSGAHHSAGVADAINTYYGRPDIPIGAYKGDRETGAGLYTQQIATGFPNDVYHRDNVSDAVSLYRQILSEQPDNSVTIVTVGFLVNIEQLLKSGPDSHSTLNGLELISAKVNKLVSMAGKFPEGREFNFFRMADSSAYVSENWPLKWVLSGAEIGSTIRTGAKLFSETALYNPVREVYRLYVGDGEDRYSWDQTAVLYAVRGLRDYWQIEENGLIEVRSSDGYNWWRTDVDKDHEYLLPQMPNAQLGKIIEDLMVQSPLPAPDDDPISHWTFDNTVNDLTGTNHGDLAGGSYVTGANNQAIELNGIDEYIDIGPSRSLSLITFTLSAWVKIPSVIQPGWRALMEHDRFGSNWFGLYKSARGNTFHFRWAKDGIARADFNTPIYPDTWYHVVGSFENGTAKMYLDGSLDNTITAATLPSPNNSGLSIGQNQDYQEAFNAVIDDVQIYSRALRSQEISDLFAQITPQPNQTPSDDTTDDNTNDTEKLRTDSSNGGCFVAGTIGQAIK